MNADKRTGSAGFSGFEIYSILQVLSILWIVFSPAGCARTDDSEILQSVEASESASIVFQRKINLDLEPDEEIAAVIDDSGSEVFVILKKTDARWQSRVKIGFNLRKKPPDSVSPPNHSAAVSLRIIRNLFIKDFGNSTPTVILEYLSEDPASDSVRSQLMAFTKFRRSFDSLQEENNVSLLKYTLAEQGFLISRNERDQSEFRFNGFEFVPWDSSQAQVCVNSWKLNQKELKAGRFERDFYFDFSNCGGVSSCALFFEFPGISRSQIEIDGKEQDPSVSHSGSSVRLLRNNWPVHAGSILKIKYESEGMPVVLFRNVCGGLNIPGKYSLFPSVRNITENRRMYALSPGQE